MALIDKDQIRAEIERLDKHYLFREYDNGWNNALDAISKFLDTLQEMENPIYELNQFLINWVRDGQTDAEKDARWEAYRRFFDIHDEAMMQEPNAADKNAVKEIVKTTRKEVTRQVKEMVKKQPDGLEEELENYAKLYPLEDAGSYRNLITLARHFAEWQKKQDDLETADLLAIAHLQGMEQQKAKMLEGAVGKYVHELYTDEEGYHCYISLGTEYAPGDKVRVIVIKEN